MTKAPLCRFCKVRHYGNCNAGFDSPPKHRLVTESSTLLEIVTPPGRLVWGGKRVGSGRKPVYTSDAERQRAYRERAKAK